MVPKQWKKMVFASAGQKWRDFKSKLTTWYIIPFMDSPELFQFPPDDYRSIHADQWQEFVKDRISPQFQVCKIQSVVILLHFSAILALFQLLKYNGNFGYRLVGIPAKTNGKEERE